MKPSEAYRIVAILKRSDPLHVFLATSLLGQVMMLLSFGCMVVCIVLAWTSRVGRRAPPDALVAVGYVGLALEISGAFYIGGTAAFTAIRLHITYVSIVLPYFIEGAYCALYGVAACGIAMLGKRSRPSGST